MDDMRSQIRKPWEFEGFTDEDVHESFRKIDLHNVHTLFYMENGMILAGVSTSQLHKDKHQPWIRLKFPLILQHIKTPQGQQLMFTRVMGVEGEELAINGRTGITMRVHMSVNQRQAWYNSALFTYGLTNEALEERSARHRQAEEDAMLEQLKAQAKSEGKELHVQDFKADGTPLGESRVLVPKEDADDPAFKCDDEAEEVQVLPTDILEVPDEPASE